MGRSRWTPFCTSGTVREGETRISARGSLRGRLPTGTTRSTPGKLGGKLLRVVARRPAPDSWARPTTNIVHWLTGAGWGIQYSVLGRNAGRGRWALGLLLGPSAWATSYVVLPPLGLYKPIWEYDAGTLEKDLSAHMLFGIVTAGALEALT